MSGNIGAEELFTCCQKIEIQAGERNVEKTVLKDVEQALETVIESLAILNVEQNWSGNGLGNEQKNRDTLHLKEVFIKISALLEEYDIEALDYINENRQVFHDFEMQFLYDALLEVLEQYDFEEATRLVQEMAEQAGVELN